MMKETTAPAAGVPALGFSLQIQLDKTQQRQIVFQSHLPLDAEPDEVNKVLDKVVAAAERQIKKQRLVDLRRDARDLERQLKFSAEDMVRIDAQMRAEHDHKTPGRPFKLTPPQRSQREQAEINAKRGKEMLEDTNKAIIELEAELS
jgi:hypothetical protein